MYYLSFEEPIVLSWNPSKFNLRSSVIAMVYFSGQWLESKIFDISQWQLVSSTNHLEQQLILQLTIFLVYLRLGPIWKYLEAMREFDWKITSWHLMRATSKKLCIARQLMGLIFSDKSHINFCTTCSEIVFAQYILHLTYVPKT